MSHSRLLINLALRACERGDPDGAAEVLRAVLASDKAMVTPAPALSRAVTVTELAPLLGYSARHLRTLIERGAIPPDAVLGRGRARRVFVDAAIDALRLAGRKERIHADEIERDGAEHAARRPTRGANRC